MTSVLLSPQEERIEKNKGRVELKGREQKIYDSFQNSKSVVDVQRAKYFTESFKETEGQALSLRWAKALYHIAEKIDVVIDDSQLIVGRGGKQGKYGIIYPELDGCFLHQFVKQASSRIESPFEIAPEDIKIIEEEIVPYWQGKTYYEDFAHAMPKDVLKITYDPKDLFSSRFILNESSSMRSALQWVHDYKKGIDLGFETIKAEAQAALDNLDEFDPNDTVDKAEFYESIIIVSDAIILWAKRHGDEAARLADSETDVQRKKELLEISRICYKVPAKPAETFHEALQAQRV